MSFDVIIRGARVVDGTGGPSRMADVGVRGDRVAEVGDLSAAQAPEVVDGTGRVVSPGFVDTHAHTDLAMFLADEHADIKRASVIQGVTTEVSGNCGFSPFPALPAHKAEFEDMVHRIFRDSGHVFDRLAGYRERLASVPLAVNVAPLLGHGSVRRAAMGSEDRPPTGSELDEMKRLVDLAMEDGAFGMSTGLTYAPSMYAGPEEIIALSEVVARHGRRYASHMRNEADGVVNSIEETLRVGRETGAGVHVSHHKVAGVSNWGRTHETLTVIEEAQRAGEDVTLDAYPYTAGSTGLIAMLPRWFHDHASGTPDEKLADPAARRRIAEELEEKAREMGGGPNGLWDIVHVAAFPADPTLLGRTIAEIAENRGMTGGEAVLEIVTTDPATVAITHGLHMDDVRTIISRGYATVGSDGIPLPGLPHPRIAGTFATVLHWSSADDATLVDAVRRMTSLACDKFGIPDRGVVTPGKVADLVVFDPAAVAPGADYERSLDPPTGITDVLVSGRFAVRGGVDTGVCAGSVLSPRR